MSPVAEIKTGKVLLQARRVVKRFGGLTAVKEVSLEVRAGEIVGLIGPNGAGKTTFFNCLNAVTRVSSGEIIFAGQSLVSQVTPETLRLVIWAGRLFGLLSLLWLPLVLGVVWPETFFRLEAVLALTLLTGFRIYLLRPLGALRPWSRLLLNLFVMSDLLCALVWLKRSESFSEVVFFGLFRFYPLLVPGALLLFLGAALLFLVSNLPRVREAFGQHLRADVIARLGMGRTFQNIRLFSSLSALDNVKLGRHGRTRANFFGIVLALPGARREELDSAAKAEDCLRFVGLGKQSQTRAGSLAYGDQRRLEIARALASEPRLLLLDEPAAGMNPTESAALIAVVRRISQAGIAVLIIEHDMKVIMNLASRIYVLDHGELIASGSPTEIRNHEKVIAAYLGARHAVAEA
ncbi:MAG TPA: ABC transporter ATP-binding protein [Proteobacteria bacterium]|nr:ABC transporter ATP-binding protein [Pseudomonadota bacterium]